MKIFLIIILLIIFFIILEELYCILKGDCKIKLTKEQSILNYQIAENSIKLTYPLNFINLGKQQGLIIDTRATIQPQDNQKLEIFAYLNNPQNANKGYWEAVILKPQKILQVELIINIYSTSYKEAKEILNKLKKLYLDIYYKYYGRTEMIYKHLEISFNLLESKEIIQEKEVPDVLKIEKKIKNNAVIPIKTHLLRPGENLFEVIKKYVLPISNKGDILAIAESALAIIQGRVKYAEDIKPRFLAKRINYLFDKDSSLSSVYSLEMAFQEIGTLRIILATLGGILGKVIGRKGDFYRIAGKRAAAIDDCTGTVPPYDKYVVLAPDNLKKIINEIKRETNLEVAIVDVNDLKKVDILASTSPELHALINEALKDNPQGNANEKTPFVLIRR